MAFIFKLATVLAFFVCLLVICSLIKTIKQQQQKMQMIERKNQDLIRELNRVEDLEGLKADFEAILYE